MSCHVSVCPNHQTGRTVPFDTRGRIASLGAFGYELDVTKMTEEEKEGVKAQIEAYKRIDDLVLSGDLYRLSNALESNYFCVLVVRKDKGEAYVVGERGLCIGAINTIRVFDCTGSTITPIMKSKNSERC